MDGSVKRHVFGPEHEAVIAAGRLASSPTTHFTTREITSGYFASRTSGEVIFRGSRSESEEMMNDILKRITTEAANAEIVNDR
jgi:hypothetical protein